MTGLELYTLVHVVLSLVGIGSGLIVLSGWLLRREWGGWTSRFLWTTVATSVTGFGFPVDRFMPSHGVGIISLIVLAVAIVARRRHLAGAWRRIYVVTAVMALYFNVFVLVVQLFRRVPSLNAMAPTQSEPPFQIAQLLVLALFVVLGAAAAIRFRAVPSVRTL